MNSEKVKEINKKLQQINERELSSLGMILQFEIDVNDILTLINELESENEALQKGVKRLKKRYEETITKNADECVKKFCETTMYHEQEKLIKENEELAKQCEDWCEITLKKRNQIIKLKDRIAELEKENDRLNKLFTYDKSVCDRVCEFVTNIKQQTSKETAEKILNEVKKFLIEREYKDMIFTDVVKEFLNQLTKQFGVEIKE